jgi:hypothetical protein
MTECVLETHECLYAMAKAVAALSKLEALFAPHRGLGSVVTHVTALREQLEEHYDSCSTHAERSAIADRLDEEANAIVGSLCDYPCPPARYSIMETGDFADSDRELTVSYERVPLPSSLAGRLDEIRPADEAIIEAAVYRQNFLIGESDANRLIDLALTEDHRAGYRPAPPPHTKPHLVVVHETAPA